jgi:hypothetical protein
MSLYVALAGAGALAAGAACSSGACAIAAAADAPPAAAPPAAATSELRAEGGGVQPGIGPAAAAPAPEPALAPQPGNPLYEALGLDGLRCPSDVDIRKAYHGLCRQYHPDRLRQLPAAEEAEAATRFLAAQVVVSDFF